MIMEQENVNLKIEVASLKAANSQQKRKVCVYIYIFNNIIMNKNKIY